VIDSYGVWKANTKKTGKPQEERKKEYAMMTGKRRNERD
jgi:hypothetical protein